MTSMLLRRCTNLIFLNFTGVSENEISRRVVMGQFLQWSWLARKMGGRKAELINYATSGDITGDNSAVVGYAALAVI